MRKGVIMTENIKVLTYEIEKFKLNIETIRRMRDNYVETDDPKEDAYLIGLYNGFEFALAMLERRGAVLKDRK